MTAGTSPQSSEPKTLRSIVSRIQHAFQGELSPADVAQLRRSHAGRETTVAEQKILAILVAPHWPASSSSEAVADANDQAWAPVLCAMAHLGSLMAPGPSLGEALAEAGLSEARLDKLLRSDPELLPDAIRTTAQFLASKGQRVNPLGFAELSVLRGAPAESVRRSIARQYFRHTFNTSR